MHILERKILIVYMYYFQDFGATCIFFDVVYPSDSLYFFRYADTTYLFGLVIPSVIIFS